MRTSSLLSPSVSVAPKSSAFTSRRAVAHPVQPAHADAFTRILFSGQGHAPAFSGETPTLLHIAAQENDLDAVRKHLKNPAINVDEPDDSDNHNTALHTNLNLRDGIPAPFLDMMERIKGRRPKNENPNPDICKALLKEGKAKPNTLDAQKRTPFHIYLLRHPEPDREIVTTLLEEGTRVDLPDEQDRTALRNFVEKHAKPDPWTIQKCLESGAQLIGFPPDSIATLKKALQRILPEPEFKRFPQFEATAEKQVETDQPVATKK